MNKQLLTILKKRYGIFILVASVAIIVFYVFLGISDVNRWKEAETFYSSDDFITELKQDTENLNPKYRYLSLEELKKEYAKDHLTLFIQPETFDEEEKLMNSESEPYYTMYFNENSLIILGLVSLIGFGLFFIDLNTSFNEFLFSLGVSKRRIYFSKYLIVGLPILSSVLIAKILFFGIITTNIPAEYVNIDFLQLATNVLAVWAPLVFFFSVSAFISLITGHMIFGPLTLIGFYFSFEPFISSLKNATDYFNGEAVPIYKDNFFQYAITKNPIAWFPIVFALAASLLLFILGNVLFSSLTLEKKGSYLLFDKLRIPVIIAMTIYVPMVLVFSRGFYSNESNPKSPFVALFIYGILTALISSYIIFKKEIDEWINQKNQIKGTISVRE